MADAWPTLGLAEAAREFAHEMAEARARRRPSEAPGAASPGDSAIEATGYDPDITADLISLTREYSPADLNSYRVRARAGDPRLLFSVYAEMNRFGPGPQREKWRMGQAQATATFSAIDVVAGLVKKGRLVGQVDPAIAYIEQQFRPHLAEFREVNADRCEYGVAGAFLGWEPMGAELGRDRLESVVPIQPIHFRYDRPTREWLFLPDVRQTQGIPCSVLVEMGLLFFVHHHPTLPIDQRGLNFQALVPFMISMKGWRWWARFVELVGIPMRLGTYKQEKEKAKLEEICRRSVAAGWAVLQEGSSFQFLETAVKAGSMGQHEPFVRFAEECYDKIYLGHSQGSAVQGGGGSVQSSSKASEDARQLFNGRLALLGADLGDLGARVLTRNVAPQRGRRPAKAVVVLEIPQPVDRKQEAEIVKIAKDSGLGCAIAMQDAVERLGHRYVSPEERKGVETLGDPEPQEDPQEALDAPDRETSAPGDEKPAREALARVIDVRGRFAAAAPSRVAGPPDVDAPYGIGEEIVEPYRQIVAAALESGLSPVETLDRLRHRMRAGYSAPELDDRIASAMLIGFMRGTVDTRRARGERA